MMMGWAKWLLGAIGTAAAVVAITRPLGMFSVSVEGGGIVEGPSVPQETVRERNFRLSREQDVRMHQEAWVKVPASVADVKGFKGPNVFRGLFVLLALAFIVLSVFPAMQGDLIFVALFVALAAMFAWFAILLNQAMRRDARRWKKLYTLHLESQLTNIDQSTVDEERASLQTIPPGIFNELGHTHIWAVEGGAGIHPYFRCLSCRKGEWRD